MNKDISLIITDLHLKPENIKSISALMEESLLICEQRHIKSAICLGDVFDSRIAQRECVLTCFGKILDRFDEEGVHLYCIPGNHDKTNYEGVESFLSSFKYHPSFTLIDQTDFLQIGGIDCYFIPFFDEAIWKDELDDLNPNVGSILFSHIAIQGSKNNDHSIVQNSIKVSDLKSFKKVYLGHYHDYQKIGTNIFHLGSIQQNNFGEDEKKGFWILKEEGEVELIKSLIGQSFKKITIDLENTPKKQISSVIEAFRKENQDSMLRVEVWGETENVSAFDKTLYADLGIDIQIKHKDIETVDVDEKRSEVKSITQDEIVEKFKSFCTENAYNYKEGYEILKKSLWQ